MKKLLPVVNWDYVSVNDNKTSRFVEIVSDYQNEEEDSDDEEEYEANERRERDRKEDFDKMIDELLKEQIDEEAINDYKIFVE